MGFRDGTPGHHQPVALRLEPSFTTVINPLSHTVEHVQQYLILKVQWYVCDWVQVDPEGTVSHRERWFVCLKFLLLLNCLLFPSLHLWPHGSILPTSEQSKSRLRLDLQGIYKIHTHNMQNMTSVSQAGWALEEKMLLSGESQFLWTGIYNCHLTTLVLLDVWLSWEGET